jgi:cob(I)alamin adenosyltransferase
MKIYTKTGDDGQTGLFGGSRVRKDDPRVEAYGCVDETNALLGVAAVESKADDVRRALVSIQSDLFSLGAELACDPERRHKLQMPFVDQDSITLLESTIDALDGQLSPLENFVLPGGTLGAALLHQARTVCRRAERRVLSVEKTAALRKELLIYLNRLSDLLFVMARFENQVAGADERPWQPRGAT